MNIAMAEMADLCNLIRTLKVLEADGGLKDERLTDEFLGRLMAMGDAAPRSTMIQFIENL